jgi:hypothetical protein
VNFVEQIPIFGTVDAAAKFWTLILGIWAISAVVNVALADVKGRNPYVWGLIGLFFGPFGILIMLWRLARKKKPETKLTSDEAEKKDE